MHCVKMNMQIEMTNVVFGKTELFLLFLYVILLNKMLYLITVSCFVHLLIIRKHLILLFMTLPGYVRIDACLSYTNTMFTMIKSIYENVKFCIKVLIICYILNCLMSHVG